MPGALTLEFLEPEEKVIVVQEVQVTVPENGLLLGAQLGALLGLKRLDAGIPIYRDALWRIFLGSTSGLRQRRLS